MAYLVINNGSSSISFSGTEYTNPPDAESRIYFNVDTTYTCTTRTSSLYENTFITSYKSYGEFTTTTNVANITGTSAGGVYSATNYIGTISTKNIIYSYSYSNTYTSDYGNTMSDSGRYSTTNGLTTIDLSYYLAKNSNSSVFSFYTTQTSMYMSNKFMITETYTSSRITRSMSFYRTLKTDINYYGNEYTSIIQGGPYPDSTYTSFPVLSTPARRIDFYKYYRSTTVTESTYLYFNGSRNVSSGNTVYIQYYKFSSESYKPHSYFLYSYSKSNTTTAREYTSSTTISLHETNYNYNTITSTGNMYVGLSPENGYLNINNDGSVYGIGKYLTTTRYDYNSYVNSDSSSMNTVSYSTINYSTTTSFRQSIYVGTMRTSIIYTENFYTGTYNGRFHSSAGANVGPFSCSGVHETTSMENNISVTISTFVDTNTIAGAIRQYREDYSYVKGYNYSSSTLQWLSSNIIANITNASLNAVSKKTTITQNASYSYSVLSSLEPSWYKSYTYSSRKSIVLAYLVSHISGTSSRSTYTWSEKSSFTMNILSLENSYTTSTSFTTTANSRSYINTTSLSVIPYTISSFTTSKTLNNRSLITTSTCVGHNFG